MFCMSCMHLIDGQKLMFLVVMPSLNSFILSYIANTYSCGNRMNIRLSDTMFIVRSKSTSHVQLILA